MMKRLDITISEVHIKRLKIMSKKTGLSVSDLIRRAVDEYWEKFEKKLFVAIGHKRRLRP